MLGEKSVKIITDLCDLNAKAGGICSEWCVGAAEDAELHLFGELGIPRDYPWCIVRGGVSVEEARAIVCGFHNIGCETSFRMGKNATTVQVFAYRKMANWELQLSPLARQNMVRPEP